MADNNQGPLGGLTGEEPWALEVTQEKIYDLLKDYVQKTAPKNSKALEAISKNIEKIAKSDEVPNILREELKKTQQNIKEDAKASKDTADTLKKQTKQDEKYYKDFKDITDKQARRALLGIGGGHLGDLDRSIGSTISSFENFDASISGLGATIAGLPFGSAIGALVGWVGNTTDQFRNLIQVGQSFGGSLINMNLSARDAAMNLEEFSQFITKYGRVSARVGAQELAVFTKEVRDITREFGHFGLTVNQLNDLTADYTEQLIMQGRFDQLTDQQRRIRTADYIRSLTQLSELTGKRIDDLQSERKEMSESVDKFVLAGTMSEEGRKRFLDNMQVVEAGLTALPKNVQGPLHQTLLQFQRWGTLAQTELGQFITQVGGPVRENFESLAQTLKTGTEDEVAGAVQNFLKSLKEAGASTEEQAKIASFLFEGQAQSAKDLAAVMQDTQRWNEVNIDSIRDMIEISETQSDLEKARMKEFDDATQNILGLQEALRTIYAEVSGALLEEFGENVTDIAGVVGEAAKSIVSWIQDGGLEQAITFFKDQLSVVGTKFMEWWPKIENVVSGVIGILGSLHDNLGLVVGVFGTLVALKIGAAMFALVKTVTQASSMLGGMITGGGFGGAGRAGGGFLRGAGRLLTRFLGLPALLGTGAALATDVGTEAVGLEEGSWIDKAIERTITGATIGGAIGAPTGIGIPIGALIGGLGGLATSFFGGGEEETQTGGGTPESPTETAQNINEVLGGIKELMREQNQILMSIADSSGQTAKYTKNTQRAPGDDLGYAGGS